MNAMSYKELTGWQEYFSKRPIGWREDHRASVISQSSYQGKNKLKVTELFPSLDVIGKEGLTNAGLKRKAKNNPFINMLRKTSKAKDENWLNFLDKEEE